MKRKIIIIIFSTLLIFFMVSSNYTISPPNPFAGQAFIININLSQYGIFNINPLKSFLKTNNPDINIISYKVFQKNNKYYLKIKMQIFSININDLQDLIFFDGNSYYNFGSIKILFNFDLKEQYLLTYYKNFQKYLYFKFFIIYLLFLASFYIIYFIIIKIKSYLYNHIKTKKEKKILLENFNKLINIKKEIETIGNNIIDFELGYKYKEKLIKFNSTLDFLLRQDIDIIKDKEIIEKLKLLNKDLNSHTYKSEKNLYELRKEIFEILLDVEGKLSIIIDSIYK
ncbi:MAG TPA: hypothetical protein PLF21_04520 [Exilispira sp.]|nr:hypothetical protein [Exilispira sp.]